MAHQPNYHSRVLPNVGGPLETTPENHRVVSRRVLRGSGENYYRINIVQSNALTPYPGNLDYRIERKVNADTKNKQFSKWQILDQGQIGRVSQKVVMEAASMLHDAWQESMSSEKRVDLERKRAAQEWIPFAQMLRQFGSVGEWRSALTDVIFAYRLPDPSRENNNAPPRAKTMAQSLSLIGFSDVEWSFILQTYTIEAGFRMNRNYYVRYLKAAHLRRYAMLNYLQFAYQLYLNNDGDGVPEHVVDMIEALIPKTIWEHLARPSGLLQWTVLNFSTATTEDLRWDLLHGGLLPDEVFAMHPDLVIQFGFNDS